MFNRKKPKSRKAQKKPRNLREYLLNLYKDPLTFSNSIEGLYQSAKKNNNYNFTFTREDIREFLKTQSTYQQLQPIQKEYKQQKRTVIKDRNLKWQMDLIDMRNYADDNNGVQYLLTIIDVFSKYAMVFPLKDKKGKRVAKILRKIFDYQKPLILLSDNGLEFINWKVKNIIDLFGVHHFSTYPYTPLGIIERINKTIKSKIFAYMNINHTRKYVDVLDLLLQNYNKSRHSTIKDQPSYIQFCEGLECDERKSRVYSELKYIDEKINATARNLIVPYEIGDAVRVVAYFDPRLTRFEQFNLYKVYHKIKNPKWTDEIYYVRDIYEDGYIIKYVLKDVDDKPIQRKYYHHELQKIF